MPTTLTTQVTVTYSGTDIGKIYLNDIGGRNQLGSGLGIYHLGQDQYISHGHAINLVTTGDVMMSVNKGRISKYVTKGNLAVTYT